MKKLTLISLFVLFSDAAFAASPSFQNFNTNDFTSAGQGVGSIRVFDSNLTNVQSDRLMSRMANSATVITTNTGIGSPSQGIATDNLGNRWDIGTTAVSGPGSYGVRTLTTNNPSANYTHLGDGAWYNNKLYLPIETFISLETTNAAIGVFNAGTPGANFSDASSAAISIHSVSNIQAEIAALAIDPVSKLIWVASFYDLDELFCYDLDTLEYRSTLYLNPPVGPFIQGIEITNNIAIIACGEYQTPPSSSELWAADLFTGETRRIYQTNALASENEGLAFGTNGLLWSVPPWNIWRMSLQWTNTGTFKRMGLPPVPSPNLDTNSAEYTGINDGLQLYWPFSESGTTNISDYSGKNVRGYFTATNLRTNNGGVMGNGAYIDGASQYARALDGYVVIGFSNLTASCWFKKGNTANAALLLKHSSGSNGEFFISTPSATTLQFTTVNSASVRVDLSATVAAMNDGIWHHAAGTYDGVTMRLWFDGTCIATAAQTNSILRRPGLPLFVGCCGTWTGEIDEVKIWNRSLRTNEVRRLYRDGNPP